MFVTLGCGVHPPSSGPPFHRARNETHGATPAATHEPPLPTSTPSPALAPGAMVRSATDARCDTKQRLTFMIQRNQRPGAIAVNARAPYWTEGAHVIAAPRDSREPEIIATARAGEVTGVSVEAGDPYWTDTEGLYRTQRGTTMRVRSGTGYLGVTVLHSVAFRAGL